MEGKHKGVQMFKDLKKNVSDWNDEEQIKNISLPYWIKAFDRSGLIYGMYVVLSQIPGQIY